jgi:hypothetical protein
MATHSEAGGAPPARVPVTLFQVTFTAAMDGEDLAVLAGALDMPTTLRSGRDASERDLGFARLDHFSGLFLRRGTVEGDYVLQAVTWGHPGREAIHRWHVAAAAAARQLDPSVKAPDRAANTAPPISVGHVGRSSNRRMSRLRRRLVGVS